MVCRPSTPAILVSRTVTRDKRSSNKAGVKLVINRAGTAQDGVSRVTVRDSKTGLTRGRQSAADRVHRTSTSLSRDAGRIVIAILVLLKNLPGKKGGEVGIWEGAGWTTAMNSTQKFCISL